MKFNAQVLIVIASTDHAVVRERAAAAMGEGLKHGLLDAYETGMITTEAELDLEAGYTEIEVQAVVEAESIGEVSSRIEAVMALPIAQQNCVSFETTDDITELEDTESMGEHA